MRFVKHLLLLTLLTLFFAPANSMALENIKVGSTTRTMIVIAPNNLPDNRPLIINMHGMNQDAGYQQAQAKWENIADTAKFVVVLPNGISNAWDISGTRDIEFITTIIDTMSNRYGIDRNRVYLSGFSMGGMMTYHAASFIADKIAAFAPVSGYKLFDSNFTSSRPIPIIQIQGEADDVVVYNDNLLNYTKGWVARNNCPSEAIITKPYPSTKANSIATKYYWGPGDDGSEVILITQAGKGHWWSMDEAAGINTSAEIWNFCKRFSLDPGKPTVEFTAPAGNSVFSPFDTINIEVSATDIDGEIINVQFFNGDSLLATDSVAPYGYQLVNPAVGSYKISCVATDNDAKTNAASININVNPPVAPALTAAVPVINSFNLPLSTNTFSFTYSKVVDCANVKALLTNQQDSIRLVLQETGFSTSLTFTVPDTINLSDGDYTVIIYNIIGEHEIVAENDKVMYSFGETTGSATVETIFTDEWNAENVIPMGWKVTYNSNVREQGTEQSMGPRILKFLPGGDFEYGMYLRDESDVSRFTYGTYDDSRLVLQPGMYFISFYYSWWTLGAASNNLKIQFAVTDTLNNTIFEQRDIETTHGFADNRNVSVIGSQYCEFSFNITKEQPYVLQWSTEQFGYDGAIIGGVKLVSVPSTSALAAKYKAALDSALVAANNTITLSANEIYNGAAKNTLKAEIEDNNNVIFTTPGEYQAAIDVLVKSTDALFTHKTYVDYQLALSAAKEQVAAYKGTAYKTVAPYLKLVEKVSSYNAVDSSNVATMLTACDSLSLYTAMVPNWINIAIPALTYRLNKAVELNEILGGKTELLNLAGKTFTDDDNVVNQLNEWNTIAVHNALSTGTFDLGSTENSLDLTGYIKNPNFYTMQTDAGLSSTTFPGWTVTAATSGGASEWATAINPVIDTDAHTNTAVQFEQTITGLPVGIYNVSMNTRIPEDETTDDAFIFYAVVANADTLKADFEHAQIDERIETSINTITVTDGTLTIGVRTSNPQSSNAVICWGDPSLRLANKVEGYTYPYTGVKQVGSKAEIKETHYFTIQGQRLGYPVRGINIVKTIYTDGSVDVSKMMLLE